MTNLDIMSLLAIITPIIMGIYIIHLQTKIESIQENLENYRLKYLQNANKLNRIKEIIDELPVSNNRTYQ